MREEGEAESECITPEGVQLPPPPWGWMTFSKYLVHLVNGETGLEGLQAPFLLNLTILWAYQLP